MKIINKKEGSALIWAMILMLSLAVIVAAGLSIAGGAVSRAAHSHNERQAYYTARSAAQAVRSFLDGVAVPEGEPGGYQDGSPEKLISSVQNEPLEIPAEFPDDMGECTLSFERGGDGIITVRARAVVAGKEGTVGLVFSNEAGVLTFSHYF